MAENDNQKVAADWREAISIGKPGETVDFPFGSVTFGTLPIILKPKEAPPPEWVQTPASIKGFRLVPKP